MTDFKQLFEAKIRTETRLVEILVDFYQRQSKDTMIGYFFTGKDLSSIAQKQAQFLLKALGIKQVYSGKTPASAHLELPAIRIGHFNRRLRILEDTLRAQGFSTGDIQTWVAFESRFKDVVVT